MTIPIAIARIWLKFGIYSIVSLVSQKSGKGKNYIIITEVRLWYKQRVLTFPHNANKVALVKSP